MWIEWIQEEFQNKFYVIIQEDKSINVQWRDGKKIQDYNRPPGLIIEGRRRRKKKFMVMNYFEYLICIHTCKHMPTATNELYNLLKFISSKYQQNIKGVRKQTFNTKNSITIPQFQKVTFTETKGYVLGTNLITAWWKSATLRCLKKF